MLYDIEGHELLRGAAVGLTGNDLRQEAAVAERVLGLRGPGIPLFVGDAGEDAKRAVAMQVSLQRETEPEAHLAQSVERAAEKIQFREGIPIHPVALEIVTQLFAEIEEDVEDEDESFPVTGSWR